MSPQALLPFRRPSMPLRAPVAASTMAMELRSLPADQLLVSAAEYEVYIARSFQIPAILLEIGRLREVSFRLVGEGTGRTYDLDRFDEHYEHLFIWNPTREEVVGAYRLARIENVIRTFGISGLYTASLFRLNEAFFSEIGPAVEAGRSFIRPEYQRKPASLLMLWKGIGHYMARSGRCHTLFGPVSISDDYEHQSREAMVSYFKQKSASDSLAGLVKPRNPFRMRFIQGREMRRMAQSLADPDALSKLIADLEEDKDGIPVLLRHYLSLGGRVIDFNVDPAFGNSLDALIVVNLSLTGRKHLDRYMGRDGAGRFLARHVPATGIC